jgi:hypothetical protein
VKFSVQTIAVVLAILAGAVLTLLAERYEREHPLASVQVLTPGQWASLPSPPKRRTRRSPALMMSNWTDGSSSKGMAASEQDSLVGLLMAVPVLQIDSLRWRLRNECCGFNLLYPVSLQFKSLLQTIAHEGGSRWTIVVPDSHFSTWMNILKKNSVVKVYPK